MTIVDINNDFLNYFKYQEKNNYHWEVVDSQKENIRNVFFGKNENNEKDDIYVKQIKITSKTFSKILKEIYFLILLKNKKYFVNLDDIIKSDDNQFIFLLFKGKNVSLNKLIQTKTTDYLSNKNLVKWIIYQISFGLYFLHSNNIIHNDIKSSNILIDAKGNISICDLGSATYENKIVYDYSISYSAPEYLNNNIISSQKLDMWGLGVIIIDLFLKYDSYFKKISQNINKEEQLKFILSKFGFNENISKEEVDKLINDDKNPKYIIFDKNESEQIGDEKAIDLIKHLLTLNSKIRYNSKQVLLSSYLDDYYGQDNFNFEKIDSQIINEEIPDNMNKNEFIIIFENLKSKLKELNKSG